MRNNPMHSRTTNNAGSCVVFQPRSPQVITRYVSRDRLIIDVVCPKTSKLLLAWGTRLGMKDIVRMASTAMIGTLTQNAARHPVVETSAPPMIGPSAAAMPPAAPHNPIIFARSLWSEYISEIRARELGTTIAPPTPWSARALMRIPIDGDSAQAIENNAKRISPNRYIR